MVKKMYRRVGVEDLKAMADLLELPLTSLSEKLGYQKCAAASWLKQGSMPEVAQLALRGLMAEAGQELPVPESSPSFILTCYHDQEIKIVYNGKTPDKLTLSGKTYFLIPEN